MALSYELALAFPSPTSHRVSMWDFVCGFCVGLIVTVEHFLNRKLRLHKERMGVFLLIEFFPLMPGF